MRHLVLEHPAVLVKRTTAKEQERRVVAAPFTSPPAVVENHLNVVTAGSIIPPRVPVEVLAALLNSEPVDRLFRSLSGTVAVSATELAALPLPAPDALDGLLKTADRDRLVLAAYLQAG
jgi:adenine-specific DNA-methyltransferase